MYVCMYVCADDRKNIHLKRDFPVERTRDIFSLHIFSSFYPRATAPLRCNSSSAFIYGFNPANGA
jgi:hypothetical protein